METTNTPTKHYYKIEIEVFSYQGINVEANTPEEAEAAAWQYAQHHAGEIFNKSNGTETSKPQQTTRQEAREEAKSQGNPLIKATDYPTPERK